MKALEILKIAFVGSVDDGKSTLIGRIFYDQDALFEDQKQELIRSSKKRGSELNLALFTDGLKSEREQGITIDIAYRYFSSDRRRYIVIDCPGHAQYLRNMVTGCSQADVVIVLIDVLNGITEQTRRHIAISSLLQVPNIIFAINKMDLTSNSQDAFNKLKAECEVFLKQYHYHEKEFIPISATLGDNVIRNEGKISWYQGPALFEAINQCHGSFQKPAKPFRFQVQRTSYVQHPQQGEFRGYAGFVHQGTINVGDPVKVGPKQISARIAGIHSMDEPNLKQAQKGQSITLTLDTDLDCNRGDYVFSGDDSNGMSTKQETSAFIFNLGSKSIDSTTGFLTLKRGSEYLKTKIVMPDNNSIQENEIGKIGIRLQKEILINSYEVEKHTGSFILIHPVTNETMAVGLFA